MASPQAPAGADVAVIGGGVIGLAIAWRAACAGATVTVVDERPGGGASWAAAGMLAPVTEVHYGEEPLLALALESARRYPGFVEELEAQTGRSVGYRRCGTLMVARDPDDKAALDDVHALHRRLGLESQVLRGAECRVLEPSLAPSIRSGVLVSGDHQIDNRALTEALLAACRRAGVAFRAQAATSIQCAADRVAAVVLADGEVLGCGAAVLAAGAWSSQIQGLPAEVIPPIRPVKGQLVHLRGRAGEPPLASRNIRGLDVYVVSRADGRVVVGATVEEQGFDMQVTAGAVHELLRDAYELLPGLTELVFSEAVAGLRPGSPDNAPLLGAAGIDGLIVATGHYRNGVLLTPVTADAIAELLSTGHAPEVIAPFSVDRFVARVGDPG
ncbi:MAG TPA: glycine oxidase ThiO [Egibacteraceae bacterium]|nr:glycine oxidase ThiO [Egibacteraceae bacterium]